MPRAGLKLKSVETRMVPPVGAEYHYEAFHDNDTTTLTETVVVAVSDIESAGGKREMKAYMLVEADGNYESVFAVLSKLASNLRRMADAVSTKGGLDAPVHVERRID